MSSAIVQDTPADILVGVTAITQYMRVLTDDPDFAETKTYNWLNRGYLPGRKLGAMWLGSKSAIRERLRTPTNLANGATALTPK